MWFCIAGALLCSSPMSMATFQVPGPLLYAPPMRTWNYAWNYAASLGCADTGHAGPFHVHAGTRVYMVS